MSINHIDPGGLSQIGNLKSPIGAQNTKQNEEVQNVEFSSVLKGPQQVEGPGDIELAQRAEKVAALKAQVEDGSYKPDLEKVADSLVNFLLDSE